MAFLLRSIPFLKTIISPHPKNSKITLNTLMFLANKTNSTIFVSVNPKTFLTYKVAHSLPEGCICYKYNRVPEGVLVLSLTPGPKTGEEILPLPQMYQEVGHGSLYRNING